MRTFFIVVLIIALLLLVFVLFKSQVGVQDEKNILKEYVEETVNPSIQKKVKFEIRLNSNRIVNPVKFVSVFSEVIQWRFKGVTEELPNVMLTSKGALLVEGISIDESASTKLLLEKLPECFLRKDDQIVLSREYIDELTKAEEDGKIFIQITLDEDIPIAEMEMLERQVDQLVDIVIDSTVIAQATLSKIYPGSFLRLSGEWSDEEVTKYITLMYMGVFPIPFEVNEVKR